ncbi:ComEA family DNA-binding protein [Streptomyces griseoflavus]
MTPLRGSRSSCARPGAAAPEGPVRAEGAVGPARSGAVGRRVAQGPPPRVAVGAGRTDGGPDSSGRGAPDGVPEPGPPASHEPERPPVRRPDRAALALRERLPLWMQTRCGLERRSVLALSALLVLVLGFAVQHFWTGRTQPVRAPEVVRAAAPDEGRTETADSPQAAPAAATARSGGPAAPEIVVDVGGKVREPGIHRLPAGSRVEDALRAAGGVRPGTRTDALNRARFLVDGEHLVVGAPAPAGAGTAASGSAPGTAAAAGGPTPPVSLNTATLDQLDALPGVGPVLAQHIIDHRTRSGGFRSVDELREVNGIGDRRFADLRDLVRP